MCGKMVVKGGYATRACKCSLLPLCIPEVATRVFAQFVLHTLKTYLIGYEYMQDEGMYANKLPTDMPSVFANCVIQHCHNYIMGDFGSLIGMGVQS